MHLGEALAFLGENAYEKTRREKVDQQIDVLFPVKFDDSLYQGIANEKKYKIICHENLDDHILASILFEEGGKTGFSYTQALDLVQKMTNDKKEEIMKAALGDRGPFDRMPRALQHTTLLMEFFMDF